jgi:prepilin-type N-terminal cleavage/methylation domain-containing protein
MNDTRRASNRRQAGYSLPEMITVVAIIGVLALVTVPSFISYYQSNKVKSAMREFTADVRRARGLAISRGTQMKLSFGTGSGQRTYQLFAGDSAFGTVGTWRPVIGSNTVRLIQPDDTVRMPQSIRSLEDVVYFPSGASQTFTDLDSDGKIDVVFFPDGRVAVPTGQAVGSITIKSDLTKLQKPTYRIDINAVGRVTAN